MRNNDLVDMIVDHRIFLSLSLCPMHCNLNDASSAVSQPIKTFANLIRMHKRCKINI